MTSSHPQPNAATDPSYAGASSGLGDAFDTPPLAPPPAHQQGGWGLSNQATDAPPPPALPRYPDRREALILPDPEKKTPPPKRSRAARSSMLGFLSGSMTLAALAGIVALPAYEEAAKIMAAPGPLEADTAVLIPRDKGTAEIIATLAKEKVVSAPGLMSWWTMLSRPKLLAGEYQFKAGVSMDEVIEQLKEGKVIKHKITFPEGWSSDQIVARLRADPILQGDIKSIPDEGTLMPDTYDFERGDTRMKIIDRMRKTQEQRLKAVWDKRDTTIPLATMRDLLVLASIVEKETGKADERPRVAAVFLNRLKKGMKLETDPTILYGLYKGAAWTEARTLTKADLASTTPYNTYRIQGLPPGPIANPGKAALEAVANPAKTDDIFFVADGTGGHVFTNNLADHTKAVAALRAREAAANAANAANAASVAPAVGAAPAPAPAPPPAAKAAPAVLPKPAAPVVRPRPVTPAPAAPQ